jgi:hypothetical protein
MISKLLVWSIVCLILSQLCESKLCGVNIDCDINCIKHFGTDTRNIIDLFQKSISPYNVQNNIDFKLEDVRYHSNLDFGNRNPDETIEYYKNWRKYMYPYNNCINILLTNIGSYNVLGIAYVAGKCTTKNVAVVNSNINLISMSLVMSHEIGHTLGLKHTCELNSKNIYNSCAILDGNDCNPSLHPYLMYPQLNTCSKNINKLSRCSIQQFSQIESELTCESFNGPKTKPIKITLNCNKSLYSELTIISTVFIFLCCLFIGCIIIYIYATPCALQQKTDVVEMTIVS